MSRTTDISTRLRIGVFASAAAVLAVAVTLALIADTGPRDWLIASIIAALAPALDIGRGRFLRGSTVSIADLPLLASVVLLEPGLAMLTCAVAMAIPAGLLGAVSRAGNLVSVAVPAGVASGVLMALEQLLGISGPRDGAIVWLSAGLVAVATYPPVHYLVHGVWTSRAHHQPLWPWLRENLAPLLRADAISILVVVPLVEVGLLLDGTAVGLPILLAIAGGCGMWITVRTMARQVEARELKDEFFRAIFVSLARLLEMKDPDTAQHSARVALFSRDIAGAMGLSEQEQSRIHLAGLLHDVGKVGVPDEILLKPGRFSNEERRIMERHPRLSAEAIAGIPGFGDLTRMVYAHHERLDGSGYPEGLAGPGVPLGARILGVADTFEALTADRPYRDGRSAESALQVFEDEMHLFDPDVVDALRYLVLSGAAKYKAGTLADFSEEWSRAAKFLDVKLDEEPFEVPPEVVSAEPSDGPQAPAPPPAEDAVWTRRESDEYSPVGAAGSSEPL